MGKVILSDANTTTNAFKQRVEQDGFAVVPACLDEATVELLDKQFDDTRYPERNLLSVPSVRALAISRPVREIMETILGSECFAVRGIFFNKTRSSNWKVVWHQDLTIAVRERAEVSGFGPWTMKAGILHVQPPPEIMSGLLAIRLHVDESGIDNGPLRVIAGSHRRGRLSAEQIGNCNKETSVTCTVPKGGALVMRPLLLHASSSCVVPKSRRVITVPRLGHNQAIGAIAHRQCRLIWLILHKGVCYEERGPAVTKRSKQKRTARMIRQLRNLGYRIELPNSQHPNPTQAR